MKKTMGSGTVVLFENRHSDLCNKLGRAMQATGTDTKEKPWGQV